MNIWEQTLELIKRRVSLNTFENFFKPTSFDHQEDTTLFVRVPAGATRWMMDRKLYVKIIRICLKELHTDLNITWLPVQK
jgi:hypothetical protein